MLLVAAHGYMRRRHTTGMRGQPALTDSSAGSPHDLRPEKRHTRMTATTRARPLILSAGMGAGHDGVATELARCMAALGVDAYKVDVLDLFPLRLGDALRGWYMAAMRHTPWL